MEQRELEHLIRKEVRKYFITGFDCPSCEATTTGVKITVIGDENEELSHFTKIRCMNCLDLFKEALVKEE